MSQLDRYKPSHIAPVLPTERIYQVTEGQLRSIEANRGGWQILTASLGALCVASAIALVLNAAQGDKVIIIQPNGDTQPRVVRY